MRCVAAARPPVLEEDLSPASPRARAIAARILSANVTPGRATSERTISDQAMSERAISDRAVSERRPTDAVHPGWRDQQSRRIRRRPGDGGG